MTRFFFFLLFVPVLVFAPPVSGLVSEGIALPPTSISTESSVASMLVNPALIGLGPSGAGYLHEDGRGGVADGRRGDAILARLGGQVLGETGALALGASLEWLRPRGVTCTAALPCVRRGSLGLSAGTSTFSGGFAWRSFSSAESEDLDALDTFDVGLVVRPASWLSLAATADTLNAPTVDGVRQPRLFRLGLGLRPFGSRLTFAADAGVDDEDGFEAVRFDVFGRVRLVEGLDVLAQASPMRRPGGGWDTSLGLGLAFGLGHGAISGSVNRPGAGRFFDSTTLSAELISARGPRLGGASDEAQILDLAAALKPPSAWERFIGRREELDPFTRLVLRLQQLGPEQDTAVLVLVLGEGLGLSFAEAQELRAQVLALRARGTKVVAWMSSADDATYLLASAADRVWAAPQALLQINGLVASRLFLLGLLQKVGVEAEFVRAGRYKSAPEQFTDRASSPPAAEATNAVLDDTFARYVSTIASARGLEESRVRALLDEGAWLSDEAVGVGLIDAVLMPGQAFSEAIADLAGRRLRQREAGPDEQVKQSWGTEPAIAIVTVTGNIVDGGSAFADGGSATSVVERLRRAALDPTVKAIVLRVDSPGGEVTASERIWAAVEEAKKRKPVVASFGAVAASGGYYVAAGANAIFAEPDTLTGSIGVFVGKADLSGLYDKVGVSTEAFVRGKSADLFTTQRPWTEAERGRIASIVDGFYESFLQRVATGRNMSRDEVHEVAQGRIWTGAQAKDRRLVDALGGLAQALGDARARAGLPNGAPIRVYASTGLFQLPEWTPTPGTDAMEMLVRALGGQASAPLFEALMAARPLALALDLPEIR